jgi:cell cycle checkpoint protein
MSGVGDGLFEASMENAKTLSGILKAVQFQETVTCFISPTGIKVTAEQAKSVQANAFVKSELFQTYSYNEDTACAFRINLNALIVSISI